MVGFLLGADMGFELLLGPTEEPGQHLVSAEHLLRQVDELLTDLQGSCGVLHQAKDTQLESPSVGNSSPRIMEELLVIRAQSRKGAISQ